MTPIIKSKQQIIITPVDGKDVKKGDIVFAKVKGKYWMHLVTGANDRQVEISNNHGHVNGWTDRSKVYGIIHRKDIGDGI